ncbi:methyltransferase [Xenorhabdus innexi]|uniref:Phenazine-specific methyltransferase PhzM n=1 Tax=Xenorhabdus innexi TaxID=290109 RepID=A0A1N6MXZ4_9GAMM|nr:methyltransferase [Xenorhabdus innexi]PHM38855.1 phenazine-specific methyltransferase PhzM [Xenorhabdus innexi]SIP73700.1 putative O-demethylpuromycin O-methyltransferase [Xenorhabdus innexi]
MMLSEITIAYRKSAALFAFVESKAPLYLTTNDGKTVKELAQLCHVSEDRFNRLFHYMQTINVLTKKEDKFYLTEQCASLSDPNSLETLHIKFELNPTIWNSWSKYNESLHEMNNKSAFEINHHQPYFDYISHESNKNIKVIFDNFMSKVTDVTNKPIIKSIPLRGINSLVDIGGGLGSLAKEIKIHYPHIQCYVMDLYDFDRKESEGVTFIKGDFFAGIPSEHDAYCIKNVLHNWPDQKAVEILRTCHKAMRKDSVLYIIEMIKEPDDASSASFDLYMDIIVSGKSRYYSEFESIAKQAGLSITNRYNLNFSLTGSQQYIIEMRK